MAKRKGVPRASLIPSGKARPRAQFTPPDPERKLLVLCSKLDLESPWCLTGITQQDHLNLLRQVRDYETLTVNEVFAAQQQRGQKYPLESLPNPEALARLAQVRLDDRDEIVRLRITGEQRLYGFLEGQRSYALWWDPHHEIWPSKKKQT